MVRALENHKDYEEHHQEIYNDHDPHQELKKNEKLGKKTMREVKHVDQFMDFTPEKKPPQNDIVTGFIELAKHNIQKQNQPEKSVSSSSSDTEDLERTKTKARRMNSNGKLLSSQYMDKSIQGDTFDLAIAEVLGETNPSAKKNKVLIVPDKPSRKKPGRLNSQN